MTLITLEKLAAIEEAARKASYGPWLRSVTSELKNSHGIGFSCHATGPVHENIHDECVPEEVLLDFARADAAHMSASNPITVLSMVETIRKLTEVAKFYGKSENYIFHNPQQVEFVQTGVKIITAQGGVLDDQGKRARALLEEIGVKG